MIQFLSSEDSVDMPTAMDVYSYAEDWCLFTISDNLPNVKYADGQGASLTYGLGGETGAATIPHLFSFSQHCSTSGQYSFPDMTFLQEHVSAKPMKQYMDIEVEGELTTFIIGEFPIENSHENSGLSSQAVRENAHSLCYSYSYTMSTDSFRKMAAEMMELHATIFSV